MYISRIQVRILLSHFVPQLGVPSGFSEKGAAPLINCARPAEVGIASISHLHHTVLFCSWWPRPCNPSDHRLLGSPYLLVLIV